MGFKLGGFAAELKIPNSDRPIAEPGNQKTRGAQRQLVHRDGLTRFNHKTCITCEAQVCVDAACDPVGLNAKRGELDTLGHSGAGKRDMVMYWRCNQHRRAYRPYLQVARRHTVPQVSCHAIIGCSQSNANQSLKLQVNTFS